MFLATMRLRASPDTLGVLIRPVLVLRDVCDTSRAAGLLLELLPKRALRRLVDNHMPAKALFRSFVARGTSFPTFPNRLVALARGTGYVKVAYRT